jgi:hypothetical protein
MNNKENDLIDAVKDFVEVKTVPGWELVSVQVMTGDQDSIAEVLLQFVRRGKDEN